MLLAPLRVARAQDPVGSTTAAQLLEYCRSNVPGEVTTCEMTLFGIVVMHSVDQEISNTRRLFCVSLDLRAADLRTAVVQQLAGNVALLDQQFVGSVVVALAKAFPCKR